MFLFSVLKQRIEFYSHNTSLVLKKIHFENILIYGRGSQLFVYILKTIFHRRNNFFMSIVNDITLYNCENLSLQIFEKVFKAILLYSQSFCQKKYFFNHILFCSTYLCWSLSSRTVSSAAPLLNYIYGVFFSTKRCARFLKKCALYFKKCALYLKKCNFVFVS